MNFAQSPAEAKRPPAGIGLRVRSLYGWASCVMRDSTSALFSRFVP